jgi:glutaminase
MHNATLPLQHYLATLHEQYRRLNDGEIATYIPELAKADPEAFGICIVTSDGHAYAVGDTGTCASSAESWCRAER